MSLRRLNDAIKRCVDILVATIALVVLSPGLLVVAAAIKLDSRGPVFFRQTRIGRQFRPFRILKFRTMTDAPATGPQITASNDLRITSVGRWLRRSKLDELPQLFNVLCGNMSLVGPRPEVPKYVEMFREDFREVLSVRPGITDPASICFRNEEQLLAQESDAERAYVDKILPAKLALAKAYVRGGWLGSDLILIIKTLSSLAS